MKQFGLVLVFAALAVLGCSSEPKPDPAKDASLRASFNKTPDINTLNPGMRKWVEAKIQESKSGKPLANSMPPSAGK